VPDDSVRAKSGDASDMTTMDRVTLPDAMTPPTLPHGSADAPQADAADGEVLAQQ
jgi:hypothetical protein